jgi:hypothetical protein
MRPRKHDRFGEHKPRASGLAGSSLSKLRVCIVFIMKLNPCICGHMPRFYADTDALDIESIRFVRFDCGAHQMVMCPACKSRCCFCTEAASNDSRITSLQIIGRWNQSRSRSRRPCRIAPTRPMGFSDRERVHEWFEDLLKD